MPEKERRNFISLGNILTILGMFGAVGLAWGERVADNADTKRRVSVIEQRQLEDRVANQADRKELKSDVKETNANVQKILRKLEAMEAVEAMRQADRRRERQ